MMILSDKLHSGLASSHRNEQPSLKRTSDAFSPVGWVVRFCFKWAHSATPHEFSTGEYWVFMDFIGEELILSNTAFQRGLSSINLKTDQLKSHKPFHGKNLLENERIQELSDGGGFRREAIRGSKEKISKWDLGPWSHYRRKTLNSGE